MKFIFNAIILFLLLVIILIGTYLYLDYTDKIDTHIKKQVNTFLKTLNKKQESIIKTKLDDIKVKIEKQQNKIIISKQEKKVYTNNLIKEQLTNLKYFFYDINIITNNSVNTYKLPAINNIILIPLKYITPSSSLVIRKKNKTIKYRLLYITKNLGFAAIKILKIPQKININFSDIYDTDLYFNRIILISFNDNPIILNTTITNKINREYSYKFYNCYNLNLNNNNTYIAFNNKAKPIGLVYNKILLPYKYIKLLQQDDSINNILYYPEFLITKDLIIKSNLLQKDLGININDKIKSIDNLPITTIKEFKNLIQLKGLENKEFQISLLSNNTIKIIKLKPKYLFKTPDLITNKLFNWTVNQENIFISSYLKVSNISNNNFFKKFGFDIDSKIISINDIKINSIESLIDNIYYNNLDQIYSLNFISKQGVKISIKQ